VIILANKDVLFCSVRPIPSVGLSAVSIVTKRLSGSRYC